MRIGNTVICAMAFTVASPIEAQDYRDLHRAADAAIVSDIVRDRQAERDAKRQPYTSPVYGSIRSSRAARDACAAKARQEAGSGARILGRVDARSMATGWEVEGMVSPAGGEQSVPFVCSIRNGSVSGILLDPDR